MWMCMPREAETGIANQIVYSLSLSPSPPGWGFFREKLLSCRRISYLFDNYCQSYILYIGRRDAALLARERHNDNGRRCTI